MNVPASAGMSVRAAIPAACASGAHVASTQRSMPKLHASSAISSAAASVAAIRPIAGGSPAIGAIRKSENISQSVSAAASIPRMIARKVQSVADEISNQITPEGLAALEARLHELETAGRQEMAERLRTARAWGDLKENAEYHAAKDAQAHLETKILRLRELRRNAVVVEPGSTRGEAALGVAVTVRDLDSGREATHTLVSAAESDPAAGRLSIDSPLGRALAGARAGEEVAFDAPRGRRRLAVVSLEGP
jgi:transcription elongation factor GreA